MRKKEKQEETMAENNGPEFNVAFAVSTVAEGLKNSKGEPKKTAEFTAAVKNLNGYFGTKDRETWLLSAIIYLQVDGSDSDMELMGRGRSGSGFTHLARFLNIPVLKTTIYRPELEALLSKHFIINSSNFDQGKIGESNDFTLLPEVRRAVL